MRIIVENNWNSESTCLCIFVTKMGVEKITDCPENVTMQKCKVPTINVGIII